MSCHEVAEASDGERALQWRIKELTAIEQIPEENKWWNVSWKERPGTMRQIAELTEDEDERQKWLDRAQEAENTYAQLSGEEE
jgi:Fe-S cluster assembly scaffold protein SufB